MREAGVPDTGEELQSNPLRRAPPTGGRHSRSTRDPAQRPSSKGYVKPPLRHAKGRSADGAGGGSSSDSTKPRSLLYGILRYFRRSKSQQLVTNPRRKDNKRWGLREGPDAGGTDNARISPPSGPLVILNFREQSFHALG